MTQYVAQLFYYITELFIFGYLALVAFQERLRFNKRRVFALAAVATLVSAALIPLLIAQLNGFLLQRQAAFIPFFALLFFLYRWLIEADNGRKLFILMLSFAAMTCFTNWARLLEQVLFLWLDSTAPGACWVSTGVLVCLTAVFLPLLCNSIRKQLSPIWSVTAEPDWRRAWMLLMVIAALPVAFFISGNELSSQPELFFYQLMISLLPFLMYYFILFTMQIIAGQQALSHEVENARNQLALQTSHYHRITERIEQSRKARHDLRHHMAALSSLAGDGNLEAIQKYLREYTKTLTGDLDQPLCRNYAVDVIARYYMGIAKSEHIDVTARLNLPEQLAIDDMDICIVFGNCLENAVEACRALPENKRFIRMNSILSGRSLVITIENSYRSVEYGENGALRSQKEGGGIGLSNVRAIAQKYNGHASFQPQDDFFVSIVVLSQPVQTETEPGM